MNDAMVISNSIGTIVGVNEALLKLFGYRRSELMGQNVSRLMPSSVASVHDSYVQRFNETNEKRLIGKPRKMIANRKGGGEFGVELRIDSKSRRQ
jgi:PAS domain S-box-containing protein